MFRCSPASLDFRQTALIPPPSFYYAYARLKAWQRFTRQSTTRNLDIRGLTSQADNAPSSALPYFTLVRLSYCGLTVVEEDIHLRPHAPREDSSSLGLQRISGLHPSSRHSLYSQGLLISSPWPRSRCPPVVHDLRPTAVF